MIRWRWNMVSPLVIGGFAVASAWFQAVASAESPAQFRAGAAVADITPNEPTPMWGYGARRDALSQGTLDPLRAKALVIEANGQRLAIVATDLGRGPTAAMTAALRKRAAERSGIDALFVCGSHSHHTPVIELTDRPDRGRGRFDAAVAYAAGLPERLTDLIDQAAQRLEPARLGATAREVPYNRNRHSKKPTKPTDPTLTVLRLDRASDGSPLAILVNFAAHPTMIDARVLQFSADYPGALAWVVERAFADAPCLFLNGAAGDLSPNPPPGVSGHEAFGRLLGKTVVELAQTIETRVPERPQLAFRVESLTVGSRIDFANPIVKAIYAREFFPELVNNFADSFADGIRVEWTVAVLNDRIGLVGAPGEFFCDLANRLRRRADLDHLLFLGYCNDHLLYVPTIEAVAEGGYGADLRVAPVAVGTGELVTDRMLIRLYELRQKLTDKVVQPGRK